MRVRSHKVCYYCGLKHPQVEAGGVHHCPNPCCLGPGQSYARKELESYREVDVTHHTVDLQELCEKGLEKARVMESMLATWAFINVAKLWWEGRIQ